MRKLAPRILLFYETEARPELAPGWIALPQIATEAFGDGSHPTTRLCAAALDFVCSIQRPQAVLDVGTGTGVLARIARLRGATRVVGTDIDPNALGAALKNCALDSSDVEIEISRELPDHGGATFDLVIANILEGPLKMLAPNLAAALKPEGRLLISGFTPLQVPSLHTAFSQVGLRLTQEARLEGWVLLEMQRA